MATVATDGKGNYVTLDSSGQWVPAAAPAPKGQGELGYAPTTPPEQPKSTDIGDTFASNAGTDTPDWMSSRSPAISRVAQAAVEGYKANTPDVTPGLIMSPINYGLAQIPGVAGGLFRGGQQAVEEFTPSISLPSLPPGVSIPLGGGRSISGQLTPGSLGREIAAMPEAFPTGESGGTIGMARPEVLPPRPSPSIRLTVDDGPQLGAYGPPTAPPPTAPTPSPSAVTLNRLLQLIQADQDVAVNKPAFIPPTTSTSVTGEVTPIQQPRNPLMPPEPPQVQAPQPQPAAAPAPQPAPPPAAAAPPLPAPNPATSAGAKQIASAYYDIADQNGGTLTPQFTNKFIDSVGAAAPQTEAGAAVAGQSAVSSLVDRLQSRRDQPMTLQAAQEVDEGLGNLIDKEYNNGRLSKDGKNLADIQQTFRDQILNAGPDDITGGTVGFDALGPARQAWSQAMKLSDLERIQTRADYSDNPATAIKSQLRTMLSNPARMRGYSPDEVSALQDAANRGVLGSALHVFGGRLVPLIAGAAGMAHGGPLGAIVEAGAAHAITSGMRNWAAQLQAGRLGNAAATIGQGVPQNPLMPPP